MSNKSHYGFTTTWVLALQLAFSLAAQSLPVKSEEPVLEAAPIFQDAVPGLSSLSQAYSVSGKAADDSPGTTTTRDALEAKQVEDLKRLKDKDREGAVARFADDLFDLRQLSTYTTDGGVSEDYVLGPGDHLKLHVYGSTPMEAFLEVDGRGMLSLPKVGSLKAGGLSLAKAKQAVQALVSQNFARSKADLQVSRLREIRVSILGEVYQPGSYLVSSLGSLVNVLSLAGGPTSKGSAREIRVTRGGMTVFNLDLYPLRAEGKGNPNFTLQSGDVIFVPLAKCVVTLEGAFLRLNGPVNKASASGPEARQADAQAGRDLGKKDKRSVEENWFAPYGEEPPRMTFEMLPGEGVPALLNFAGGLLPEWSSGVISLRRSSESGAVEIRSLAVNDPNLASIVIQRGDVLSALPRRERDEKMVTLEGWVRVQGQFARTEGLRVGALLNRDQQILPDSYMARGEILRTAADGTTQYLVFSVGEALKGNPAHDLLLENRDKIKIYPAEILRVNERVKIMGPVPHPGEYKFHQGMRASDLVFLAGVPLKSANRMVVELARTGKGMPSEIRRLNLVPLLSDDYKSPVDLKDDAENPLLQPDDQLTFFEKPDFKVHRVVKITGQVALPGNFVLDEKPFTLSRLIARAGGFTPEAMPKAGILLRHVGEASKTLLPPPSQGQTQSSSLALPPVSLATKTPTPLSNGVDEILERLSEVKRQPTTGLLLRTPVLHGLAEGTLNRMVVNFPAAAKGDAQADIDLQDGDEIIIPEKTEAAFVVGETASPFGTYKLTAGMKVKDLLDLAGGTTRNADTWNIRLLRANGQIQDRGVKNLTVEPGDTVLVPQVVRRDTTWQENLAALTPVALILNAVMR